MCAEFRSISDVKKFEAMGFFAVEDGVGDEEVEVKIYDPALVLLFDEEGQGRSVRAHFSLKPPGTQYSTFNARLADQDDKMDKIIRIYEKWAWKKPFAERRCLIPMLGFLEPIYLGEHAGKFMAFRPTSGEILYAAGIWEQGPSLKKPGETYLGFSIIVHTALPLVLKTGHHRSPVFLSEEAGLRYLGETMTDEERYSFLLENRVKPELVTEPLRSLAKGWEKRVKANAEAHEREMEFAKKFERHG